jgi:hypothetical protein
MQKAREAKAESVDFALANDTSVSYTTDRTTAQPGNAQSEARPETVGQPDAAGQARPQDADGELPPCCRGGHQTPKSNASESADPAEAAAVDAAIESLQADEPQGAVHAAMVDWRTLLTVGAVGLSYLATQHLTRHRPARDPRDANELIPTPNELN